jgi:hypothetical protein
MPVLCTKIASEPKWDADSQRVFRLPLFFG